MPVGANTTNGGVGVGVEVFTQEAGMNVRVAQRQNRANTNLRCACVLAEQTLPAENGGDSGANNRGGDPPGGCRWAEGGNGRNAEVVIMERVIDGHTNGDRMALHGKVHVRVPFFYRWHIMCMVRA